MRELRKIVVSNFPSNTSEADFLRLFSGYGVEKIAFQPNKFAIVTFDRQWRAEKALEEKGNTVWRDCWLTMELVD